MRISDALRTVMADAAADEVDIGAGTAVLEVYSGSAPANIGDAPAGTQLLSFDLPNPAFGNAATGVVTLNGVPIATTGLAAGTAGYARLVDRNGDVLADTQDVGTSGNTVTMSTTTISIGLDVDLTAMTMTQPAGTA
jgi:hypothetical protein